MKKRMLFSMNDCDDDDDDYDTLSLNAMHKIILSLFVFQH